MSSLTESPGETGASPNADRGTGAAILPPRPASLRHPSANRRLGLALVIVAVAMLVMTVVAGVAIHIAGNPQFNF